MVHHLAYVSHDMGLSASDFASLTATSRVRNRHHAIGGFLLKLDGIFFQVLEGESGPVHDLMGRIALDPRHRDPRIVLDQEAPARLFVGWGMAEVNAIPRVLGSMGRAALPWGERLYEALVEDPLLASQMIAAGALLHDLAAQPGAEVLAAPGKMGVPTPPVPGMGAVVLSLNDPGVSSPHHGGARLPG
ncbi:BLUF domain-containing protein [Pararhodospirillum oryzae]|uniref:BLUF domain-containing protein n=1 Tax=Pararhodospirillum oryzae TaxID=478448 RepID=A0A512H5K7_9PROT|nr:BLUF domain-containing protein [Pararhodospirillum oryzae]GEO80660.1 hypothetical protein ROR02_07910 [Pararhodospirillum oryzae]